MKVWITDNGITREVEVTNETVRDMAVRALIKNIESAPGEASVKAAIYLLDYVEGHS